MRPVSRRTRPFLSFALSVALLSAPPFAHAQSWSVLDSGTTGTLRAFEDAGFSDLYVVGDGGYVAQSDFARTTWTPVDVGTSVDLYSARRPSSSQIWVSGLDGVVRLKNLPAGWQNRDVPTDQRVVLYSRESGCQNALGSGGSLHQTCDFGQNWDPLDSGLLLSLNHGAGPISSISWIVGDGGTILYTDDGGDTWTPQDSGSEADLNHIAEAGGGWKVIVGDGGTILRSPDGLIWEAANSGVDTDLRCISVSNLNANWLLVVGDGGTILRSEDVGVTWCRLDAGTAADLYACAMLSNSEYLVAGAGGVLLRTTDAGGECVATPTEVPSMGSFKARFRGR